MKKTAFSAAAVLLTLATAAVSSYAAYNDVILADKPVMFLGMDTPGSAQSDLSGHGNNGSYVGGTPGTATLPDGEKAADFNGSSQYLTVPASPALSVPTTKVLVVESWVKADVLQFPHSESSGYVYWLGKGNPTQGYEYANRMYSLQNSENRPNRMSDYHWNTTGGLGSGAYFQDPVTTSEWIYVTDVFDMNTGYIDIYKNGVRRGHVPFSQYSVVPKATSSPFNVGTRNNGSYFEGAIGKVAVYNYRLTDAQIAAHYAAMTSGASSGGTTPPPPPPVASAPVISAVAAFNIQQNSAAIGWTTDQVASSQVQYGLTTSYGSSAQSSTAGTSHSVALSGLTAGTVYHYTVTSKNSTTGLSSTSADNTFATQAAPTPTPTPTPAGSAPVVKNVTAVPSASGASISWTTDQVSHSQVAYGATASYGRLSYLSNATGTSHNLVLSGLAPGTYHYQVMSLDSTTGQTGVSGDFTFATTGSAPAPTPTPTSNVISGVTAAPSSSGASISWKTTEVSHSQVQFGLTSAYGSLSYQSVATGTSHNLVLNGLKTGTTYHYRVLSLDASGHTAVSGDYTFRT